MYNMTYMLFLNKSESVSQKDHEYRKKGDTDQLQKTSIYQILRVRIDK